MPSGTKIRTLARLLDASDAPVWAISPAGKLSYLSAGVAAWLGVEVDDLLDRVSVAGAPQSDELLDHIAAALAPPPGLSTRGTAALQVAPPTIDGRSIEPLDVRFIHIGSPRRPIAEAPPSDPPALTIAVAGQFDDQQADLELQQAAAIRQLLDRWRRQHRHLAAIATAGVSAAARRLRGRLQVAASTRCHVGFFGPPGSGAEAIAIRVHQSSAPNESLVVVDGPLMDAELLDATMMPLVHQLADSDQSQASALVRGLDEMPIEAQLRLAELLTTYGSRLRLLAISGWRPTELAEPLAADDEATGPPAPLEESPPRGIHAALVDALSALPVVIEPLAKRVEDIPLMAAALVDVRHAAGKSVAERLSRAALDALVIYPWPGNYEELEEAIRHAAGTARSASIGAEHLPLVIRSYRTGSQQAATGNEISLDEALRRFELRMISAAIEAADGNRAEAARRLGISRARLLRRIDQPDA